MDTFTNENKTIVCWNEHELCETCYKETIKPRTTNGGFEGATFHINTGCPTCREPMFDWFGQEPETASQPTTRPRRRIRCGMCRQEGHNIISCQSQEAVVWRRENGRQNADERMRARNREIVEARRRERSGISSHPQTHRAQASYRTARLQAWLDNPNGETRVEAIRRIYGDSD